MNRVSTERFWQRIAMACAILLLFAPTTPRTSWTYAEGGGMTHSAGWDGVALLAGLAAIAGLAVAGYIRRGGIAWGIGIVVALVAFGISAAASAGHWYSLFTGALDLDWETTTHPAPMVLPFALIAAVGVVCSLALLGSRFRIDGTA